MWRFIVNCAAVGRLYVGAKGFWTLLLVVVPPGVVGVIVNAIGGPWLLGIFVAIMAVVALLVYLALPSSPGIHTPKFLIWYRNPFRRVSFNFDNYLGLCAKDGKELGLGRFQAHVRVNRSVAIQPTEAFLKSHNSGETALVRFRTPQGYKSAQEIRSVPSSRYFLVAADFENLKPLGDSMPVEEFLRRFSGFDFVMRWSEGSFSRTFSRSELEFVIDSFRKYSNPPPPSEIVVKDSGKS